MNRLVLILALVVALPFYGNAQRKRAFLVGISNYQSNGYKVWDNIHGAEDVALLTPELKKKGFAVQSLTNEQATYQGILNALNEFIRKSKKGDIIYLHFSCHGQPVEDGMLGDEKDEKDHWDESIVPIDAGKTYDAIKYNGKKHITDDILNAKLKILREVIGPKGILYVILDACHSGDSYRPDGTIRGSSEGLSKNGKAYNSRKVQRTISNDSTRPHSNYINDKEKKGLAHIILIEACQPWEINSEIFVDGNEYGSLSYHIYLLFTIWQKHNKDLNTNRRDFISDIKSIVEKSKYWPRNDIKQNLVVESSYR